MVLGGVAGFYKWGTPITFWVQARIRLDDTTEFKGSRVMKINDFRVKQTEKNRT